MSHFPASWTHFHWCCTMVQFLWLTPLSFSYRPSHAGLHMFYNTSVKVWGFILWINSFFTFLCTHRVCLLDWAVPNWWLSLCFCKEKSFILLLFSIFSVYYNYIISYCIISPLLTISAWFKSKKSTSCVPFLVPKLMCYCTYMCILIITKVKGQTSKVRKPSHQFWTALLELQVMLHTWIPVGKALLRETGCFATSLLKA